MLSWSFKKTFTAKRAEGENLASNCRKIFRLNRQKRSLGN